MNSFKRSLLLAATSAASFGAATTLTPTYETIEGRPCFRSMEGMIESMFDLANDYPDLLTITDIGDSYLKNNPGRHDGHHQIPDGGYDIYALNATASNSARTSEEKGKMLVTSGVHAREWAPPELLGRFVELLVRGYDDDPEVTWIMHHTEVHAILYVNPDGRFVAERYPELYWRKNLHPVRCGGGYDYGVDLNRNFDFVWGERSGASSNPCADDYHGTEAESEPETKALADYSRGLFPEGQRKADPEGDMSVPYGEDNTGVYIDIHSSGGYVYYPWGHRDAASPDDDAMQAWGRKMSHFNDYRLWAGSQPDFLYAASGDTSDWAYGVLGVASLGFEIGDDFYQECDAFESQVVVENLPALLYAAKSARAPFKTIKGPDVFDLEARTVNGELRISARASDGEMVEGVPGMPSDFAATGGQDVAEVRLYVDVHPDDHGAHHVGWEMDPTDGALDSGDEYVGLVLGATGLTAGRHVLYAQATDGDGYKGPVTSVFVDVAASETSRHGASLRGSRSPST
jgi:hypothetical protein